MAQSESDNENHPPWPWADTWPVARMSAKGGDIELVILSGSSGRTLAFGPGHMSTSVLPGEVGNSIIAGHRDTHFQFLQFMSTGESLVLDMPDGRKHLFRVSSVDVVDSRRGSLLLDTDTPMLSLVTCYPFASDTPGGSAPESGLSYQVPFGGMAPFGPLYSPQRGPGNSGLGLAESLLTVGSNQRIFSHRCTAHRYLPCERI